MRPQTSTCSERGIASQRRNVGVFFPMNEHTLVHTTSHKVTKSFVAYFESRSCDSILLHALLKIFELEITVSGSPFLKNNLSVSLKDLETCCIAHE